MPEPKQINIRDFQHNLAMYINLVKVNPLSITRNGVEEALVINPKQYTLRKRRQNKTGSKKTNNIINSKFIGMYKARTDWKDKTTEEISKSLREKSWHGK